MTMKKRTLRVVLQVNSQVVTRPPSRKSPKREGIPPPSPLFLGWLERARDLGSRWVYREQGKAQFMSLQMADEWLWVASFTIWPKGSLTLVVHVWFLFSPPTRLTMASHLKIKDNEARWYCSVHQGADIARGTLERVVHHYPLRHAHTWLWVPSHCVWLLCRVFVLLQSQPTNVHTLKTRERGGPHPVLDHAECYHHSGWVCDCH